MNAWKGALTTMKIKRKKLLNDLQSFASQGNGVIIGNPGVGKTYLLKELRRSLKSEGTPHLLLRIDQLGDGTDKTLRQVLSYEGDLIEKLRSVPTSHEKSILLFDAFDAARNEQTRKRFLHLIQRAIHELSESWNVVVTVRTYDAMKSQELLDMFGNPYGTDLPQYHSKEILCRHFTIPPLNKDEIQQAFDQIPHLESIYKSGSQDFKCLLANPFNIWLLEKILKTSQNIPDFSHIHSEVQLLGLFWQRRIESSSDADARGFILTKIARQMVEERSLTVRQEDIYENLHLDKAMRWTAWSGLLSDEILSKVSSTGQRIAFSHNILFDYAISVLLIEDAPKKLEVFVREDPSRPLFLRPSLTYFFTRLWYYDEAPEKFWNAFWYILPSDQSAHLRLFARLIPTSVVANEARKITQLKPILKKLKQREKLANEATMRLLQSLRALQIERDELWIGFFNQVSAHYHADFAWDLATRTSDILERATNTDNTAIIDACGRVGRRLLGWVWQERETSGNDWYNRLGSFRAVPLVAKTYGTNVKESRPLLEKVLELTKEDNFPINFLTQLARHVDNIWGSDPAFVALTYCTVFTHSETGDAQTNLPISSPLLTFTSNRRQDYGSCQYLLIKHFPAFLQANPLVATRVAIRSLNFFVKKEHIDGYLKEGVKGEDLIETFEFRGKDAYFVQDNSCIWDEREYRNEPIEIADKLFQFIAETARSNGSLLDSLLDVFSDEVEVAFFWKRLLKTAAQFPDVFAPHLFELCIAKPIQIGGDALHELGLFLEAVASKFTPEQLRRIEETILGLPSEATSEDDAKIFERRRNRLISRISSDLLQTRDAKEIIKEMERTDRVPPNEPLFSYKSWSEPYTEEKWLRDQGVDTATPENQELQCFFGPLDKFKSEWLEDIPTEEATELILPPLQEAYATVNGNKKATKKVIDSLWYKLTACVAVLGRVTNLESKWFSFCRQVLLQAAKHELPKLDTSDVQSDTPMYSPFPRHEAAQGLLRLATRQPDAKMLDAIESLASDPVPSVRMVVAMELFRIYDKKPERFWNIMEDRATHETTHVVQKYLCYTLTQVIKSKKENEDKTTRVMDKMLKRTPPPKENGELTDSFIVLLMWLAIDRENSWALKTIKDTLFDNPIRFANPLSQAVSHVMEEYVVPKNLETPQKEKTIQRAIKWLEQAIDATSSAVRELACNNTEENKKKLCDAYQVIDEVIKRLYFEVAYESQTSEEATEKISGELRCRFYNEVKSLMKRIIHFALDGDNGVMFASTAHYFMQLLRSFLSCNPKEVLHLAEGVARSSEPSGYNLDSLAVAEVVKFVEIVLADHRDAVSDEQSLEDMLKLLDIFAKTGWSDALRLVWRLDEVFR